MYGCVRREAAHLRLAGPNTPPKTRSLLSGLVQRGVVAFVLGAQLIMRSANLPIINRNEACMKPGVASI
jgi:hypothetical protein